MDSKSAVEGEVVIQKGDTVATSEKFNNNEWSPSNYTGKLPNVTRLKDYFSVAVPSPQRAKLFLLVLLVGGNPLILLMNVFLFRL